MLKNLNYFKFSILFDFLGIRQFEPAKREAVKRRIKELLTASQTAIRSTCAVQERSAKTQSTGSKYIVYDDDDVQETAVPDSEDQIISHFIDVVAESRADNALEWWKVNEKRFPALALLAKKYLSVQASSANVERMFSIAGHIFSVRRRCLGAVFFCNLVWLKLNEFFF